MAVKIVTKFKLQIKLINIRVSLYSRLLLHKKQFLCELVVDLAIWRLQLLGAPLCSRNASSGRRLRGHHSPQNRFSGADGVVEIYKRAARHRNGFKSFSAKVLLNVCTMSPCSVCPATTGLVHTLLHPSIMLVESTEVRWLSNLTKCFSDLC